MGGGSETNSVRKGKDLHSQRWRVIADPVGGKNADSNFGKLCARPPWPTKVCGTAGKTQNFQRTPKRMPRLHAGIRSQNAKHTTRVTSAVTVAAAGGFLPGVGEGRGGLTKVGLGGSRSFSWPLSPGLHGRRYSSI